MNTAMELVYYPCLRWLYSSATFLWLSVLLHLLLGSSTVYGQEEDDEYLDAPPANRFLRRGYARATVLGNHVYIDGGEVSQLINGEPQPGHNPADPNNSTLSIDISYSWTASTVKIKATPKKGPVALSDQALWNDVTGTAFYIYGGRALNTESTNNITKDGIWKFLFDGEGRGTWAYERPSNPQFLKKLNLTDKAAVATLHDVAPDGVAFVIGGTTSIDVDPDSNNTSSATDPNHGYGAPIPGMVSYDMRRRDFSRVNTPFGTFVDGRAHFVPQFGSNGVLLVLGGELGGGVSDFNNITFYDPKSGDWRWQKTMGDAPTERKSFCMVGVASQAGIYELFLFGGSNRDLGNLYNDTYILSLPGFVWLKADTHSVEPRNNHDCVVIGKRQMLVLVEDWYKDRNLSDLPWSSGEVKRMFVKNPILFNAVPSSTATTNTNPAKSPTATTGPNSTTSDDEHSSASNAGPVAGGVIGGVAILGALAGLTYYIWRRRSRPSPLEKESDQSGASEDSPSLERMNELSADGQITELYVLPGELASNNEAWELDSSSRPRELDACAPSRGVGRD
ncbi:hypothetical protein B0T20DRAFT_459228, partial [Sordaria brevicollis]